MNHEKNIRIVLVARKKTTHLQSKRKIYRIIFVTLLWFSILLVDLNWDGAIRRKAENICTVKTQFCCSVFKSQQKFYSNITHPLLCYSCLLQKLYFYSYSWVSIFLTIIQQYGFNLQSHTHLISTTKFPFGTVKLNKFQFFEIEYNFLVLFGSILGKYWRTFLTISISAGILDVEKSYAFFVSLSYEG